MNYVVGFVVLAVVAVVALKKLKPEVYDAVVARLRKIKVPKEPQATPEAVPVEPTIVKKKR